jgi:hypothetical protein
MTKARDLSKLLSTANGKIEAGNVDIPPVSFENVVDTGTAGTKLASGTTQQRSSTTGIFRYNTTLGKFEGKNATDFVAIDPLPTITSVSNNNLSQDAINSGTNLVITGTNFDIGATVDFIGSDANVLNSASVTRNSSTQLTASVPNTVVNANEPYSVRVTNPSGSIVTLASAFSVNATPAFSTASGSLGTITDAQRSSYSISSAVATDAEGTAVTHSVISGSLPSGMTLNSNGTITGTPDLVTSATTSTFTVSATDGVNTSTRQFSITIGAFAITYATASGSLGSIVDTSRSSYSLSPVTATSTSGTLSYSVLSGSLPTNMSLNSSTGAITGTPSAVASDTTSTFTIRATASGSNQDRQFSITVLAPFQLAITSNQTFTAPFTGTIQLLMVGGGGGCSPAYHRGMGRGGSGAILKHLTFPVTAGTQYACVVGTGGTAYGGQGNDTTFGNNMIAKGGGAGHANGGANGGSISTSSSANGFNSNPFTTRQTSTSIAGTTVHEGFNGGGCNNQHYNWQTAGSGGAGGNGGECVAGGGNMNGGDGVYISQFSWHNSGNFAGGRTGYVDAAGYNNYGGTDGIGANIGGGGTDGENGRNGIILIAY